MRFFCCQVYVTCEMKRIIFYATITTFQKEICVRLSALIKRIIVCWWVAWAVNFSFGQIRHGHEGGTIDPWLCVCGGGGGTGRSEVKTLSISASVFTVWGTSESAEGVTLFSEGLGTGHHRSGHHSYIVGVWGHLVRGMGSGCYFGIE